jgi:hypothetical protein
MEMMGGGVIFSPVTALVCGLVYSYFEKKTTLGMKQFSILRTKKSKSNLIFLK